VRLGARGLAAVRRDDEKESLLNRLIGCAQKRVLQRDGKKNGLGALCSQPFGSK